MLLQLFKSNVSWWITSGTFVCTFFSIAIITIIIRVSRIKEFNLIGTSSVLTFNIFENSPVDTLVGKITFTDADWPFNNIKYIIVGGNLGSPPKFYIEPDTGTVKILISIDNKNHELVYSHATLNKPDPI